MFIGLDFLARRFFADRFNTQSDFLLFLIHLDDFEVELSGGFQVHGLSVAVDRFRVMAEAFDTLGNLDKRAEIRHAQNFAMHDIADTMLLEERFPNVGLHLFHAER